MTDNRIGYDHDKATMSPMVNLAGKCRSRWKQIVLSRSSRRQARIDRRGLPQVDPGPEKAIHEGIAWLGRAQDHSVSNDGGVARDFSLIKGWATSYPETTVPVYTSWMPILEIVLS